MSDRSRADLMVVAGATVLGLFFLALELVSRGTLIDLSVEDGLIEYLTALIFLVAGVLFLVVAARRPVSRIWNICLGLGCVFVAGEEISWGQRLLGLTTPESLAESNVQSEINLHNLEGLHFVIRGASVLLLLAVFVAFPFAVARLTWARRLADRLQIPRPPLSAIPVLFIGLAFMVIPRLISGGAVFRLDEVGELFVAAVLLLFAVSVWRTATDRARQPVLA